MAHEKKTVSLSNGFFARIWWIHVDGVGRCIVDLLHSLDDDLIGTYHCAEPRPVGDPNTEMAGILAAMTSGLAHYQSRGAALVQTMSDYSKSILAADIAGEQTPPEPVPPLPAGTPFETVLYWEHEYAREYNTMIHKISVGCKGVSMGPDAEADGYTQVRWDDSWIPDFSIPNHAIKAIK